jgi:hypothetical protein
MFDAMGAIPDWLGSAVLAAALAAVGYVAKVVLEAIGAAMERVSAHRARLVELRALLLAGKMAFRIQRELAGRLQESISATHTDAGQGRGSLERLFSACHETLTSDQKDQHAVIRGYTEHALRPVNQALLSWLKQDTYYKAKASAKGDLGVLAGCLTQLDAHLLLWMAKYEAWIPAQPKHALVYLADEERHGVGFPTALDGTVDRILGSAARPRKPQ